MDFDFELEEIFDEVDTHPVLDIEKEQARYSGVPEVYCCGATYPLY